MRADWRLLARAVLLSDPSRCEGSVCGPIFPSWCEDTTANAGSLSPRTEFGRLRCRHRPRRAPWRDCSSAGEHGSRQAVQDRDCQSVIPVVRSEPQDMIGLHGVDAVILQFVGFKLRGVALRTTFRSPLEAGGVDPA